MSAVVHDERHRIIWIKDELKKTLRLARAAIVHGEVDRVEVRYGQGCGFARKFRKTITYFRDGSRIRKVVTR